MDRIRSGTPLCAFGRDLTILEWNPAAEALTGISSGDAVGRPCWAVLGGTADDGSLVCHRACSGARLALEGWAVGPQALSIKTTRGRRRVSVETVAMRRAGEDLIVHLFRPARIDERRRAGTGVRLTARRREILALLDEGLTVRSIARRLGLRESTVRNHVHALLVDLGAHSQLEAVASARRAGLL